MSQEERFAEFLTRENDVRHELESRMKKAEPLLSSQLAAAAFVSKLPKKIHWLRVAAGTVAGAVSGMSACKSGCDACCHIPVMISAAEAKTIGLAIGVVPAEVPPELRNKPAPEWRGENYPCPFLRDKRCSIYENRPLPCRLLFNLDRDDYLCRHEEKMSLVPYVDTRLFMLHVAAVLKFERDYIAELRDFFPDGLDTVLTKTE